MNKFKKIIDADATKKALVLDILKLLNGESYTDGKEILDIAAAYLKENAFLDYELAKDLIDSDPEY